MLIAIDGPSGSGKSSTSRGVAERLGLAYLDTGSMYRAATVAWLDDARRADRPGGDHRVRRRVCVSRSAPIRRARRSASTGVTSPRRSASRGPPRRCRCSRRSPACGACSPTRCAGSSPTTAGGWSSRDATSPPSSPRTPTCGCCSSPTPPRGSLGGRRSWPVLSAAEIVDQVVRRDRDDSTVSQFERARRRGDARSTRPSTTCRRSSGASATSCPWRRGESPPAERVS